MRLKDNTKKAGLTHGDIAARLSRIKRNFLILDDSERVALIHYIFDIQSGEAYIQTTTRRIILDN